MYGVVSFTVASDTYLVRCERVTIDDTPRAHREDRKGARAEGVAAVLRLGSIVPPTITTKGIFRVSSP